MAIFDPNDLVFLSKYFPDMTGNRLPIFLLFGYGLTKREIAIDQQISERTVSRALDELAQQHGIASTEMLRVVAGNRLNMIILALLIHR